MFTLLKTLWRMNFLEMLKILIGAGPINISNISKKFILFILNSFRYFTDLDTIFEFGVIFSYIW